MKPVLWVPFSHVANLQQLHHYQIRKNPLSRGTFPILRRHFPLHQQNASTQTLLPCVRNFPCQVQKHSVPSSQTYRSRLENSNPWFGLYKPWFGLYNPWFGLHKPWFGLDFCFQSSYFCKERVERNALWQMNLNSFGKDFFNSWKNTTFAVAMRLWRNW